MLKNFKIYAIPILIGLFVTSNPFLFGLRSNKRKKNQTFVILKESAAMDQELQPMKGIIGNDYKAYKNHNMRVLTFTNYWFPKSCLDEIPNAMDIAGMALAYHDVALWTDGALDYLEPSKNQMNQRLVGNYTTKEIDIAQDIVMMHHKFTNFIDKKKSSCANALINAVRKGDWADATFGLIRYGLPSPLLQDAYDSFPDEGFHMLLATFGQRLSPDSLLGQLEVAKILRW